MKYPWPFRRCPADHVLIACTPKSGSTFLAKALSAAIGLPLRHVSASFGHNEQDILERRLRRLSRRAVIHQHIKGTCNNVALMKKYAVRPIVLVRNVFDSVISLDDHLQREDHRVPTGFVHREYWTMPFEERLTYLIQIHLPWYFNFFMSWREASTGLQTFPLTYERLFANVPQTLVEILAFYRVPATTNQMAQVVQELDKTGTRFNKGVAGRGETLLTDNHKHAIRQLAAAWSVDRHEMASLGL